MSTHAFAPRFGVPNVFLAADEDTISTMREPSFALIKSGPPVSADEVESDILVVEVTVRWGRQVLDVKHLDRGKSFSIGEGSDLPLPEDVLGGLRAAIVAYRGNDAWVTAPRGARGYVVANGRQETFASLIARGVMTPASELDGAHELALADSMNVVLELGGARADGSSGEPITFEIAAVRKGKVLPVPLWAALAGGATGFVGLSFLGHAAIVASLALFLPAMATDDAEAMDRDQIVFMQKLLDASALREAEQREETGPSESQSGGGSSGEMHKDESGAAGTTKPVTTAGRMAIRGHEKDAALSRKEEVGLASTFGIIPMLALNIDPNAPASKWAEAPSGNETMSARGDMFSQLIGESFGPGLGLSGTGEGGGGNGIGVGLDRIGTAFGGGGGGTGKWGLGPGDKDGHGVGHGIGRGDHRVKGLTIRPPATISTNGRLPAEVIQRIVRQNFGRFRLCYEGGLRGNPALTGRVATKFVIGRDGAVAQAADGGSDLPDQSVVACVVRSFLSLSFPAPEGGVATVTYPIVLTPGE